MITGTFSTCAILARVVFLCLFLKKSIENKLYEYFIIFKYFFRQFPTILAIGTDDYRCEIRHDLLANIGTDDYRCEYKSPALVLIGTDDYRCEYNIGTDDYRCE